MKRVPFFMIFAIFACGPQLPCNNEIDSASSGSDCCDRPSAEDICPAHPFGRKIGCGGIREPQLSEKCFDIYDINPLMCFDQYEMCRNALRDAECDECPIECLDVQGACII